VTESEVAARDYVAALGSEAAIDTLDRFEALLTAENQRQNLVAEASLSEVWRRHIADSAQLLGHVPRETPDWLDLGSGAGFPGLIVAILRPGIEVVLVESRKRRIEWLEQVIGALGIDNAAVIGLPLERISTRSFAAISARAFAPLNRLIVLASRFSTTETVWTLPKGRSAQDELAQLTGWRHMFHVEQSCTDSTAGIIVGRLLGKG
jgi:16S rRNA (guanine527-N7)-methyltransferase